MNVRATKDGITLKLSTDEALALENLLGTLRGDVARSVPWYDAIADVMEADRHNLLSGSTIYWACEEARNAGKLPPIYEAKFQIEV